MAIPDDRGDESFADDLNMWPGIVSGRVALLLRSTEIQPAAAPICPLLHSIVGFGVPLLGKMQVPPCLLAPRPPRPGTPLYMWMPLDFSPHAFNRGVWHAPICFPMRLGPRVLGRRGVRHTPLSERTQVSLPPPPPSSPCHGAVGWENVARLEKRLCGAVGWGTSRW